MLQESMTSTAEVSNGERWVQSVGIIGAGIMGQGIAHLCAKFDYPVVLIDINEATLVEAKSKIKNIHRFDLMLQKQQKSPLGLNEEVKSKIQYSTQLDALRNASIIIENVPEKIEIKRSVYRELAQFIGPATIIGANTSATPITQLGAEVKHPENVIGLHFSNPVNLLSTVEMVRGYFHDEAVLNRATEFISSLGMKTIIVNDSPGFISNRVMLMYINEAIFCVQEDVANAVAVDRIFKECLSHTMGPLETCDLIGLDTILYSLEVLYENFMDSKYRPAPLLRQMVDAGQLGRKSGKGFYQY
ncbi:MAG: 3-hydroxyacyl-CoA dehydrogenase family protein [Bacteroidota bacterium]